MAQNSTPATTRRGVLKGGAIGLGSVAGALTLGGASAQAVEGQPLMGMMPAMVAGGAANYFLQIDDIPGASMDDDHQHWIDVTSYSWGGSGAVAAAGSGTAAGRSTMQNLTFTTGLSQASPRLFLATMQGTRMASAVLEGVTVGDTRVRFLQLTMNDVVVASYQTSAADERASESISLAFQKATYSYWLQKADGTLGEQVSVTWDARTAR